jgi:hypothetical protein
MVQVTELISALRPLGPNFLSACRYLTKYIARTCLLLHRYMDEFIPSGGNMRFHKPLTICRY